MDLNNRKKIIKGVGSEEDAIALQQGMEAPGNALKQKLLGALGMGAQPAPAAEPSPEEKAKLEALREYSRSQGLDNSASMSNPPAMSEDMYQRLVDQQNQSARKFKEQETADQEALKKAPKKMKPQVFSALE